MCGACCQWQHRMTPRAPTHLPLRLHLRRRADDEEHLPIRSRRIDRCGRCRNASLALTIGPDPYVAADCDCCCSIRFRYDPSKRSAPIRPAYYATSIVVVVGSVAGKGKVCAPRKQPRNSKQITTTAAAAAATNSLSAMAKPNQSEPTYLPIASALVARLAGSSAEWTPEADARVTRAL